MPVTRVDQTDADGGFVLIRKCISTKSLTVRRTHPLPVEDTIKKREKRGHGPPLVDIGVIVK